MKAHDFKKGDHVTVSSTGCKTYGYDGVVTSVKEGGADEWPRVIVRLYCRGGTFPYNPLSLSHVDTDEPPVQHQPIEVLTLGKSDVDDVSSAVIAGMWCSSQEKDSVRYLAAMVMRQSPDSFYWLTSLTINSDGSKTWRRNVPVRMSNRIVLRGESQ